MLNEALQRWMACAGFDPAMGCAVEAADGWILLGLLAFTGLAVWYGHKLFIIAATMRAVAFTPTLTRRLSKWVKSHDYAGEDFFRADGADARWVTRRQQALDRLAAHFQTHYARSIAWGNTLRESFSDLRFTDAGRVPFPFARMMREKFNLCSVVTASDGPKLRDLDDHWTLDVTGSYGVNVAGYNRYKTWMQAGWERVKDLGPVLGPLHPVVEDNIAILKSISKLDEVSFHMSGTEAVMAAVRLARFNTRRKLIVCFAGAYHGWWDGVQPGLGNERDLGDCLTLKDLHPASLDAIRRRAKDIAGVLVNPVQSFHPNAPPPSDAILVTSSVRKTQDADGRYADWLEQLRKVCTASNVPLIFDEVYSGFRLAPGGAQEYFSVQADMVVYGKTVAGGMPIGAVCGRKDLMRRFDPDRPMRLAYVIGTFSAHPLVMGAMNEFLHWLTDPATAKEYDEANTRCTQWAHATNQRFAEQGLPLQVMNMATVWTVLFKEPSRYNWLLQYYLRAEGVTLSWVGTGRCLSNMDFTPEHYDELQTKLLNAALHMQQDGWWLNAEEQPDREKKMKSGLIWEVARSLVRIPRPLQTFYTDIMRRKHDDHVASHSHPLNQFFHILSSSVFIYCYALIFTDLTTAVSLSIAALFVRQFGHAIIEPPCHDKEELLLGFNTWNKTLIVTGYLAIPIVNLVGAHAWTWAAILDKAPTIAQQWFGLTLVVVLGRVAYLAWLHDFRTSMIWFVKLITDPLTDIVAYLPPYLHAAQGLLPRLRANGGTKGI